EIEFHTRCPVFKNRLRLEFALIYTVSVTQKTEGGRSSEHFEGGVAHGDVDGVDGADLPALGGNIDKAKNGPNFRFMEARFDDKAKVQLDGRAQLILAPQNALIKGIVKKAALVGVNEGGKRRFPDPIGKSG